MSGGERFKQPAKRSAKRGKADDAVAPFLRVAAAWEGYVNVELSDAHKEQFKFFCDDVGLVQEVTAEVLQRGYKLSVVQVDDTETVRCTATAGFSGMPDAGLAVSAWAGTFFEAAAAASFIVAVVSQFDLSQWVRPEVKRSKRTF